MNTFFGVMLILSQGSLEPATPLTKAQGTLSVVEAEDGTQTVEFSEDYKMSSGVVLDLKLCGEVFEGSEIICLSQGEVRKLTGPYTMNVRSKLFRYTRAVIFDVDLAQDHARAEFE